MSPIHTLHSSIDVGHQLRMFHATERLFRHHEHFPNNGGGIGQLLEPLGGICPQSNGCKGGFHGIRRAQMLPVGLRKVIEGHQAFPIPLETLGSGHLLALFTPAHKLPLPLFGLPLNRGKEKTQERLGRCLFPSRQCIQHIENLMIPRTLFLHLRVDMAEACPDSQVAIPDHEPRALRSPRTAPQQAVDSRGEPSIGSDFGKQEAREGQLSEESVGTAATPGLGALGSGRTNPFRGAGNTLHRKLGWRI